MLPAQIGKVHTVRAFLSANDYHGITIRCKFDCLRLSRRCSLAYCIKYFEVCTLFF